MQRCTYDDVFLTLQVYPKVANCYDHLTYTQISLTANVAQHLLTAYMGCFSVEIMYAIYHVSYKVNIKNNGVRDSYITVHVTCNYGDTVRLFNLPVDGPAPSIIPH